MLYEEVHHAEIAVSLATIYIRCTNSPTPDCLVSDCGQLQDLFYFDPNVSQHHHFFIETEYHLLHIPAATSIVGELPNIPDRYEVSRGGCAPTAKKGADGVLLNQPPRCVSI